MASVIILWLFISSNFQYFFFGIFTSFVWFLLEKLIYNFSDQISVSKNNTFFEFRIDDLEENWKLLHFAIFFHQTKHESFFQNTNVLLKIFLTYPWSFWDNISFFPGLCKYLTIDIFVWKRVNKWWKIQILCIRTM